MSKTYEYDETLTLEEASAYLRQLYCEFPFADWYVDDAGVKQSRSLAVQIAAMMSQFAVGMLPKMASRMGFIYSANSQRSGKTLLAKMALMPVHGTVAAQTWNSTDDEIRKVVDAQAIEGKSYILFDNCRGFLGSPTVEALMTSPQWTGRVLGKSKTFSVRNFMTVFITGNDCTVSTDMSYRCLTVDLFVQEAEVQNRQTSVLLDEVWLAEWSNRHKILSCLWTIVRLWSAAGAPTATTFGIKLPLGFETWGELMGGLVAFAGFGNCLERAPVKAAGDREKMDINSLVTELAKVFTPTRLREEYKFDEIVQICFTEELFTWMMEGREREGTIELNSESKSRLGKLMKRYAPEIERGGRVFSLEGMKVRFACRGSNRHRRYIVEALPPDE
ncbi:MAG: hypothetical protein WCO60_19735 [Verrucomicrobiota bacterium]